MPPNSPGASNGFMPSEFCWLKAERPVSRQFQIEQVVDHGVGADAADARGKRALDHRAGGGRARKRRYGVRERPCRRGVPQVLDGRIVVGGDAVDEIKRPDACGLGKANVGIVPRPGVLELVRRRPGQGGQRIRRAIGDLRECADIVGDRAAPESAERRQHRRYRSPCRGRSAAQRSAPAYACSRRSPSSRPAEHTPCRRSLAGVSSVFA